MAFSSGKSSVSLEDILSKVTEADILSYYLGVTEVPCIIKVLFPHAVMMNAKI